MLENEDIRVILARIEAKLDAMKDEADRHAHAIAAIEIWRHGNGLPGVATRIDRLEQQQQQQQQKEEKKDKRITTALAASITGVLGFIAILVRGIFFD
ncbi:hypothetical protein HED60_19300 [Planctomycetales bacterium ZRK34]|nr:hypothetical protein HED60_19300 [Planctomycetales bacterium ZRK34]